MGLSTVTKIAGFYRRILPIAGGAAVGQIFLIVISPLLTNIYTPSEFGTFAVYSSLLALVGLVASWRYEQAIYIAEDDNSAFQLVIICTLASIFTILILSIILLLFDIEILKLVGFDNPTLIWLLPISVFAIANYQTLSVWAARKQQFGTIGKTRVYQSIAGGIIQILAGFSQFKSIGLIIGYIFGQSLGVSALIAAFTKYNYKKFSFDLKSLFCLAAKYKNFPLVNTFSSILNNSSLLLPPILISQFYGQDNAGLLALGQRFVGLPMYVVGASIAQVYASDLGHAVQENNFKRVADVFSTTLKRVVPLGIGVFVLSMFAPNVFAVVFGSEWTEAGLYVQILSVSYSMQIITSPISATANLLERQDLQFYLDISRTALVVISISSPYLLNYPVQTAVYCLSIAMFIAYSSSILVYKFAIRAKEIQKEQGVSNDIS